MPLDLPHQGDYGGPPLLLALERQQARHDPRTGVPNSRLFFELLEREAECARRDGRALTVASLDLDSLKQVNVHQALTRAMEQQAWPVSASIGAITALAVPDRAQALVQRADELMYRAEQQGKDRVLLETVGAAAPRRSSRRALFRSTREMLRVAPGAPDHSDDVPR